MEGEIEVRAQGDTRRSVARARGATPTSERKHRRGARRGRRRRQTWQVPRPDLRIYGARARQGEGLGLAGATAALALPLGSGATGRPPPTHGTFSRVRAAHLPARSAAPHVLDHGAAAPLCGGHAQPANGCHHKKGPSTAGARGGRRARAAPRHRTHAPVRRRAALAPANFAQQRWQSPLVAAARAPHKPRHLHRRANI
ncbi:hypothetical protein T492DRAFT_1039753, partial [Pavlovales sp. CCMP2436]